MPKIFTPRQLIKILRRHGFRLVRKKGSHFVFRNDITKRRVIVAYHAADLPKGTFHEILKQAGISRDEVDKL